jgi:hypothetical protein
MNLAEKIKQELSKDLDFSKIENALTELFMKGVTRVQVNFQCLYPDWPDVRIIKTNYGEYLEINNKYSPGFPDWVRQNGFKFINEGCGNFYVVLP